MYKGLTEAKRPRRIVTKIEPALSDHLRRGWLHFWEPSPQCLRLIHPSNASLCHPVYLVCDQILFTRQLSVARASSNFAHTPAYPYSHVIKFCSHTSLPLLVRHQNSITREQNLITRELLIARASSTIPLKSRKADVGASGLIVRWKGVDMLWVASSVKGRKVRS